MEIMVEYIIEMVAIAITVLGGIAVQQVRQYFKKRWQIDLGDFLNNGEIVEALESAKRRAKKDLGEKANEIEFKNATVNWAMDFINKQFPNWLEEYGYSPETLKEYLEEKFEMLED